MKKLDFIIILVNFIIFIGCNSENNPTKPKLEEHDKWPNISAGSATSYSGNILGELLSKDSIHEGYDSLAIVLRDSISRNILIDAHVSFFPIMDMGTMKHSAPVDNFNDEAGADSLFRTGILFPMASDTSLVNGGWTLRARIRDNRSSSSGNFNDSIDFHILVQPVSQLQTIRWKGPDGLLRVAAIIEPEKPVTGTNDLEMFIGKKITALDWQADNLWTISFVPTMPSMGHSSPNNVNPLEVGGAHYKGKVNFTMSGKWRLTFTFQEPDISFTVSDTGQYLNLTVR